ncbi:MAG: hypothetical protein MJ102_02525 [Clostridia bacterium]|nr:hypothetical protein [Clostridia bacterium]
MNEQNRRRKPRHYGKERLQYLISDVLSAMAAAAGKLYRRRYTKPILQCSCAVIGAVLILMMLPAAVRDTVQHTDDSEMDEHTDPFGNNPAAAVSALVVYSPDNDWGKTEAGYLCEELEKNFFISAVSVTDEEYLASKDKQSDPANLTVKLGFFCADVNESYLESLARIGENGVEVISEESDADTLSVDINAFCASSARQGSLRLLDYLRVENEKCRIADGFYILHSSGNGADLICISADMSAESGKSDILVVSYPDAEKVSLDALRLVMDDDGTLPALVIFNGGLDCGCTDRAGLSSVWKTIDGFLTSLGIKWGYTFSSADETLPRSMINEVLTSFPGCVTRPDANGRVGSTIALISDGFPIAAVTVADIADTKNKADADAFCGSVKECTELIKRAGGNVQFTAVVPGIFPLVSALFPGNSGKIAGVNVNSSLPSYILSCGAEIYDSLLSCGIRYFVCSAGTCDTGVISFSSPVNNAGNVSVSASLSGSVGFSTPGLGGKYELNNSLRGAIRVCFEQNKSGNIGISQKYIFAADPGTNKKD